MSFRLPAPPERYDTGYFNRTYSSIETAINGTVSKIEAVESILLLSPAGSVYKVSVQDDGTLITTSVALGQAGSPPY